MIMDKNLVFCQALAVDNVVATVLEGNVIDLDTIGRALFASKNLSLVLEVTTAFTSAGSSTNAFALCSDAGAAIAVDASQTTHLQTDVYAKGLLVIGFKIIMPLPAGLPVFERYLGIQVITAGATTTAGSISAYLVMDAQNWKAYPDASN